jgi:hypothetical protein
MILTIVYIELLVVLDGLACEDTKDGYRFLLFRIYLYWKLIVIRQIFSKKGWEKILHILNLTKYNIRILSIRWMINKLTNTIRINHNWL